jgi:hypothetical protein
MLRAIIASLILATPVAACNQVAAVQAVAPAYVGAPVAIQAVADPA